MDALWIIGFLIVIVLVGILYFVRRKKPPQQSMPRTSVQTPNPEPQAGLIAPPSFYNLHTVGDFLKLVGMRVSFGTKQEEFFEGIVIDLSDSGTHVILQDVKFEAVGKPTTHYKTKNVPISEIDFINVIDRQGKLE